MEFDRLELHDYRSYTAASVEFAPGLNLVMGGNGAGKTNLLEAVYLLSAFGSHRTSSLQDLVASGAERAVVRGSGTAGARQVGVDVEVRRNGGLKILVNRVPLSAPAARGGPRAVVFSPEDLELVKGGPEARRRWLDEVAGAMRPLAGAARKEFERVLRQRNGALKAAQSSSRALASLEVWDEQMARTGAAVVSARREVLSETSPLAAGHYARLSQGGAEPEFTYAAAWDDHTGGDIGDLEDRLAKALAQSRAADLERGVSLVGPHRDEVEIRIGELEARSYASQGEQRTLALALRLAQRDLLIAPDGDPPILLLDDVFSELDESRRAELAELIAGPGQAIVTATGPQGLPAKPDRTVVIEAGKVRVE